MSWEWNFSQKKLVVKRFSKKTMQRRLISIEDSIQPTYLTFKSAHIHTYLPMVFRLNCFDFSFFIFQIITCFPHTTVNRKMLSQSPGKPRCPSSPRGLGTVTFKSPKTKEVFSLEILPDLSFVRLDNNHTYSSVTRFVNDIIRTSSRYDEFFEPSSSPPRSIADFPDIRTVPPVNIVDNMDHSDFWL